MTVRDCNGNELKEGDAVKVTKDLRVKGSSDTLKRGTTFKNIRLIEGDEEAIELMNDSEYGLTAAIFTQDENAAIEIGNRVETGTWYMNRCDYLDPALAWTGVKKSGRGCTLSSVGFEHMTRPKSFHLKTVI